MVKRYDIELKDGASGGVSARMVESQSDRCGGWVLASDYDALAARLTGQAIVIVTHPTSGTIYHGPFPSMEIANEWAHIYRESMQSDGATPQDREETVTAAPIYGAFEV